MRQAAHRARTLQGQARGTGGQRGHGKRRHGQVAHTDGSQAIAAQDESREAREASDDDPGRAEVLVHIQLQVAGRRAVAHVDVLEDPREVLPWHPKRAVLHRGAPPRTLGSPWASASEGGVFEKAGVGCAQGRAALVTFSSLGRRRILTRGFSSHSGAPSDHAPFHSNEPHGLRSRMSFVFPSRPLPNERPGISPSSRASRIEYAWEPTSPLSSTASPFRPWAFFPPVSAASPEHRRGRGRWSRAQRPVGNLGRRGSKRAVARGG